MNTKDTTNLFSLIKYWGAFAVLILHFCGFWRIYRGYASYNESLLKCVTLFHPVVIFLSVSGFLIAGSLDRSISIKDFFAKRIKRIYLPLWICTFVYLVTYLFIAAGFIDRSILIWVLTNAAGIAYTPSCLKEFATGSANGVLWTVTILIELYVFTALIWKKIKRIPPAIWVLILVILAGCNLLAQFISSQFLSATFQKILERTFFPYAVFFYIGVFIYVLKDKGFKMIHYAGITAAVVLLVSEILKVPDYGYYTGALRGILTAIATSGIGSLTVSCNADSVFVRILIFLRRADITYETYLYQWMMINILIYTGCYETMNWALIMVILCSSVFIISVLMHVINSKVLQTVEERFSR